MRPRLQLLEENLITRVLDEARSILARVGMAVDGPALRQRLLSAGLRPDARGERLLFPPDIVDWAVASAPKMVNLYDRSGRLHAEIGGDRVHFTPGSSALHILDDETGVPRRANTADFVNYVRLAHGLPHIAYLATAFSTNDDIDQNVADAWRLFLCLTQSPKPVVSGAFTPDGVPRMAEMMALLRHDRADLRAHPLAIFTITATGNFRYGADSSQNLLDCVQWGIPIEIVPVTLMGLVAPVTPVGALVFHVVDVLAGLTMAQLLRPGTPVLFGGAPAVFHMQTATSPMAAIEALQLDVAYVEVARYLGLPTQAYMALGDGKHVDAQAGAESFGGALLAALAGINSVSGPGMLDFVLVFSLAKLVLDDELCGQALRFIRPVAEQADLPTADLVQTLLAEGHLLTASHTRQHWRDWFHLPGATFDRHNRDSWQKQGAPDLMRRARAEVAARLAAYEQAPLPPAVAKEMAAIVRGGIGDSRPLPKVPPPPPRAVAPRRRRRRRGRRAD